MTYDEETQQILSVEKQEPGHAQHYWPHFGLEMFSVFSVLICVWSVFWCSLLCVWCRNQQQNIACCNDVTSKTVAGEYLRCLQILFSYSAFIWPFPSSCKQFVASVEVKHCQLLCLCWTIHSIYHCYWEYFNLVDTVASPQSLTGKLDTTCFKIFYLLSN